MHYLDYLRTELFPHFWCAGCGNGTVLGAIARAFENLNFSKENTVVVTGIGCWGKADDYVTTNSFHGTHGRALAFATGIKLANPSLNVIALMGDGDGSTIGGNHFIHAARRNVDITAVLVNNFNYGMTGGQYSATTPDGCITSTSRLGHIERGFDNCKLAIAAGASYVARSTIDNPVQLQKLIKEALKKKGFSFVEALSPCPTHFGRLNKLSSSPVLINWIKDNTIPAFRAANMSEAELSDKYITGKLHENNFEDYGTKYARLVEKAQGRLQ